MLDDGPNDPSQDEPILDCKRLWWWLVLFIEALVLSPNIDQEGSQQRPI